MTETRSLEGVREWGKWGGAMPHAAFTTDMTRRFDISMGMGARLTLILYFGGVGWGRGRSSHETVSMHSLRFEGKVQSVCRLGAYQRNTLPQGQSRSGSGGNNVFLFFFVVGSKENIDCYECTL